MTERETTTGATPPDAAARILAYLLAGAPSIELARRLAAA
jgi:hypothetical protein